MRSLQDGSTLSKLDSEQQRLHTLLVTTELLPAVRLHLPGFRAMECEIVNWLEEHFSTTKLKWSSSKPTGYAKGRVP